MWFSNSILISDGQRFLVSTWAMRVECVGRYLELLYRVGLVLSLGTSTSIAVCRLGAMGNSGDESSADRYELGAPLVHRSGKGPSKEADLVWHKVAAISGMAAVGLGAYGTHMFKPTNPTYKVVWQTANLYHLVHTVALLAAPLTKRPRVFGGLLTFGLVAFSGSCYFAALYEDRSLSLPAPFGGFGFIGAWASLLF